MSLSPLSRDVRATVHLTSDFPRHRRLALLRAERLLAATDLDVEAVLLVVDSDGVQLLVEDAEDAPDVAALMDRGCRVLADRECIEVRRLSLDAVLDGVELVESTTVELARHQAEGGIYIKVP